MTTTQDTSREALASVQPYAPTIRQRIYDYIFARGAQGATADEIEAALGIPGSTVRPRILELERDTSQVQWTLQTRLTRRGRKAVVWVASDFAVTVESVTVEA
jgi:hypothetical protein